MNYLQEAKDRIEYAYLQIDGTIDFPNSYDGDILKLIYSELKELESRKYKLVVGSEWECVVECSTKMDMHYFNWKVGDRCKVLFLNNIEVTLMHTDRGWANKDNIRHFLLCFKPIEKGE